MRTIRQREEILDILSHGQPFGQEVRWKKKSAAQVLSEELERLKILATLDTNPLKQALACLPNKPKLHSDLTNQLANFDKERERAIKLLNAKFSDKKSLQYQFIQRLGKLRENFKRMFNALNKSVNGLLTHLENVPANFQSAVNNMTDAQNVVNRLLSDQLLKPLVRKSFITEIPKGYSPQILGSRVAPKENPFNYQNTTKSLFKKLRELCAVFRA